MRVMVTGGAGFIGSNLVDRLLAEGHRVDAVDDLSTGRLGNLSEARSARQAFSFHQLDVRSPELVELIGRRRPEVIFHLAAQSAVKVSVDRPVFDAEVNVVGTLRVLEGARAGGTERVVYAASGGTLYGEPDPKKLPVSETEPHHPLSPYGVSKKAAIDYLVAFRDLYSIDFVALALANIYGPRQDPHGESGVVAIFAAQMLAGKPVTIFGDGNDTRDYVYVDDTVDAFVRAAERGGGLTINIGTGTELSVNELCGVMSELSASPLPPAYAPERAGDIGRISLDGKKAAKELGWNPFTSLEDGIVSVLDYFRQALRF
jgi:UDP-glucose 4-epimerase